MWGFLHSQLFLISLSKWILVTVGQAWMKRCLEQKFVYILISVSFYQVTLQCKNIINITDCKIILCASWTNKILADDDKINERSNTVFTQAGAIGFSFSIQTIPRQEWPGDKKEHKIVASEVVGDGEQAGECAGKGLNWPVIGWESCGS